jgi:hypothetical protein
MCKEIIFLFHIIIIICGLLCTITSKNHFCTCLPIQISKTLTENLRREETQEEYQKNLENKLESMTREEGYENWNLDDRWTKLKKRFVKQ